MSITVDELMHCEERLQTEIVERECLLAAVRVLRSHAAKGQSLGLLDLSVLGSVLPLSPAPALPLGSGGESAMEAVAESAPAPPPAEKRYIHPELQRLYPRTNVACVKWALARLPEEFSLRDVQQLLEREGYPLGGAQISVVLGRMKAAGRIREIRPSAGPNPALFLQPAVATTAPAPVGADAEEAATAFTAAS
jgi:hypothetical protein